ncbi:MAG: hypothetical protein LBT45_00570 [Rickettsiales bacterium]|nr:hypothetical protein [Rickettsiales bacterium]
MKKLVLLLFFAPVALGAAPAEYVTGRVGVQAKAIGPAASLYRPTVPVTVTNTTSTHIPETNLTNESKQTYDVELDAERSACVGTYGNVWANKSYAAPDGVIASSFLTEAASPGDNTCYSLVSVKSSEIKDMGRFFPARYFQTGRTLNCGSWLDGAALDDAILDAKKGSRTGWTIAASIAGAGTGAVLTDVFGRKIIKNGFGGQGELDKDKEKEEFYRSMQRDSKNGNDVKLKAYAAKYKEWHDACGGVIGGKDSIESCKNPDAIEVYNTLVKINAIEGANGSAK